MIVKLEDDDSVMIHADNQTWKVKARRGKLFVVKYDAPSSGPPKCGAIVHINAPECKGMNSYCILDKDHVGPHLDRERRSRERHNDAAFGSGRQM